MPEQGVESAITAFLAGYSLFVLKEQIPEEEYCERCVSQLEQEKSMSPYVEYIRLLGNQVFFTSDELQYNLQGSWWTALSQPRTDFSGVDDIHICYRSPPSTGWM